MESRGSSFERPRHQPKRIPEYRGFLWAKRHHFDLSDASERHNDRRNESTASHGDPQLDRSFEKMTGRLLEGFRQLDTILSERFHEGNRVDCISQEIET